MNIVYNSENYAILAFPMRQAFELVDKQTSRSLFVQGSVAIDLRAAIDNIPYEERSQESIDSLRAVAGDAWGERPIGGCEGVQAGGVKEWHRGVRGFHQKRDFRAAENDRLGPLVDQFADDFPVLLAR